MRRLLPLLLLLTAACQPSGCVKSLPTDAAAVSVTDDLGRTVSLPAAPKRIVSLSPAATEILFAIGAGSQVVAGTDYDNYPDEAKKLPRVGGFDQKTENLELIVSYRPDLVVSAAQSDVVRKLEEFGVPVLVLDAKTSDGVARNVELLGTVTGHAKASGELAEEFRARWKTVTATPAAQAPRVFLVLDETPLFTVGPGTFLDEMISAAGGVNVFGDTPGWAKVSDEQVLTRDADVIVIVEHTGPGSAGMKERLLARTGWAGLKAVKAGRVRTVPADLVTRPGPRLVDGLEAVAKALR
jgi:iron complex transport system substrate-binding protein